MRCVSATIHELLGELRATSLDVVLELDEGQHVEERLTTLGYRVFTSIEGVRDYVLREEALW